MKDEQHSYTVRRINELLDCNPNTREAAELRELATMLKAHEESEQIEEVLWTAFALLEPLCEENPKVISCLRDLKLITDKVKTMPEMIAGLHSRYCALSDENGPCFCPACTIVYGTAGRPGSLPGSADALSNTENLADIP